MRSSGSGMKRDREKTSIDLNSIMLAYVKQPERIRKRTIRILTWIGKIPVMHGYVFSVT